MSHHTASLQFAMGKTATAFDFAHTAANRLYWLDDNYVQPFYAWAAPRLRDVAISGLYWGLTALIKTALWLTDTTLQYMARDAHAIALDAFAHAHASLPEFPALCPAAVPLSVPSMALAPMTELTAGDDETPAIMLFPSIMTLPFNYFLAPDDFVRRWLTAALPLVPSLGLVDAPLVSEVAPVLPEPPTSKASAPVPKARKGNKATDTQKTTDKTKTPRKPSPHTTAS